jgi:hypothetical protein
VSASSYVYPFAHSQNVKQSRTDMGVDFTGKGPIEAIGDAVVVAASRASGWPEGGWVSYRLTSGPSRGRIVFVAEGITPSVHPGQRVKAGDEVARFSGSSIETGWASGRGFQTLSAAHGTQNHHGDPGAFPTPEGKAFARMLGSLKGAGGSADVGTSGGGKSFGETALEAAPFPIGPLAQGLDGIGGASNPIAGYVTGAINDALSSIWGFILKQAEKGILYLFMILGGVALAVYGVSVMVGEQRRLEQAGKAAGKSAAALAVAK